MSDILFKNDAKSEAVADGKFLIGAMYEENFGDLLPYIRDMEVTDINWNGKDLWIDDVSRGRYLSDVKLDKKFVDAFCIRIANVVSKTFNKYYPKLEAETDDLRITILHTSVSHTGTTISIRKTPVVKRITFAKSVREDFYCSEEVANLMSNAVKAKMNIVIGGLPGVGKTELVKYLTNYIFPRDRVITIEDTMEIHYSKINPNKDCVELKVDEKTFTYTEAIKSCLRLLPQWILLSEARSKEVQYLLESISTGAKCITTIHTDDMSKVPKRVVNMLGDMDNSALAENMAYSYFDVGILVDKTQDLATGKINRFIAQICLYYENEGEHHCIMLYDKGKLTGNQIPEEVMYRFNRAGINDPWAYTFIEDVSAEVEDVTGFLDDGSDEDLSEVNDTTGISGTATSRYTDDIEDEPVAETSEEVVSEEVVSDEQVKETSEVSSEEIEPIRHDEAISEEVESESDEEPTGFIGTESSEAEEEATGYMDSIVEESSSDDEEATGYMDTAVEADEDSEEATGSVETVEDDFDSEGETGFISEATGDLDSTSTSSDKGKGRRSRRRGNRK